MQQIDVNKFLVSLMTAIEGRSAALLAPADGLVWFTADPTAQRSLWLSEIIDSCASETATVVRAYGGGAPGGINYRRPNLSLQVLTRGRQSNLVMAQAWHLQEAMLADRGHARVHWRIPGKVISQAGGVWSRSADPDQNWQVVSLRPMGTPGVIGRDETERWMASVNYECEFASVAKS